MAMGARRPIRAVRHNYHVLHTISSPTPGVLPVWYISHSAQVRKWQFRATPGLGYYWRQQSVDDTADNQDFDEN